MENNSNQTFKAIDGLEIQALLATRPLYSVKQVNGQRVYGLIDAIPTNEPLSGSEVYIYNLPKDCYEDELVPIVESVGMVHQLRIKVVFSGDSEGFGYVKYCDPFVAQKAVQTLANHTIRRVDSIGRTNYYRIKSSISYDNKWLRIDSVPDKIVEQLVEFLRAGLNKYMHNKYSDDSPYGTLVLLYNSHREASTAVLFAGLDQRRLA